MIGWVTQDRYFTVDGDDDERVRVLFSNVLSESYVWIQRSDLQESTNQISPLLNQLQESNGDQIGLDLGGEGAFHSEDMDFDQVFSAEWD